jgi:hypothetical protein
VRGRDARIFLVDVLMASSTTTTKQAAIVCSRTIVCSHSVCAGDEGANALKYTAAPR